MVEGRELHPDLFGPPTPVRELARSREEFIGWIVERDMDRSNIGSDLATAFAEAFFEPKFGLLPEFGHSGAEWTREEAYDLADEDMSYWEE